MPENCCHTAGFFLPLIISVVVRGITYICFFFRRAFHDSQAINSIDDKSTYHYSFQVLNKLLWQLHLP